MGDSDLFYKKSFPVSEKVDGVVFNGKMSSRQSLKAKFDKEYVVRENSEGGSSQLSRTGGSWSDALSISMSNVNAKQAWKNGTEKLSQTLNNVRTTFGTLSQKIKKSTKRRQPLVNMESPRTPVTPYTRSKTALGRTPTKLYSPFRIDTPNGKENFIRSATSKNLATGSMKSIKKKLHKTKSEPHVQGNINTFCSPEGKLSNDLLQTQIGIYEFQSVANRIVQNGFKN